VVENCVTCGKAAPATETNYTLISAKFGWRLTRSVDREGKTQMQWRCPACWQALKKARDARGPEKGGGPSGR
jgi:hypothetical protein